MFKFIQTLFGRADHLPELAHGPDREGFVRALGQADVFVIAAFDGDGLDPNCSPEELQHEIEKTTRDLSEGEVFAPFTYEDAGTNCMPVFSTMSNAQTFCGEYSRERNKIFPLQILEIPGAMLAQIATGCRLILNDKSTSPYMLSSDDLQLLQRLWGEQGQFT